MWLGEVGATAEFRDDCITIGNAVAQQHSSSKVFDAHRVHQTCCQSDPQYAKGAA
jgi:hypothetical protein